MAKRHNHYRSSRRSQRHGGSRGSRKSSRGGGTHPTNVESPKNIWQNSSLPLGGGDLSSGNLDPERAFISPDAVEDYYFGRSMRDKSMRMGGLRPGHRNDSQNELNNSRICFRKCPMDFIKAKEVYDPSHDLIEQLRKNNRHSPIEDSEINVESQIDYSQYSDNDIREKSSIEQHFENNEDMKEGVGTGHEIDNTIQDEFATEQQLDEDTQVEIAAVKALFFVDDTGASVTDPARMKTRIVNDDEFVPSGRKIAQDSTEFNSTITIGKTELTAEETNSDVSVAIPTGMHTHPFHKYFLNVMRNLELQSETSSDTSPSGSSIENFGDSSEEICDDEHCSDYDAKNSSLDASQTQSPQLVDNLETLKITESPEERLLRSKTDDKEPEFGFLEEDYAFDVSEISVMNMRLGSSDNSYYTKCFRLFGDHEFRWISQDIFSDFILEDLGLPAHRLSAYLSFIKDSIIPKEETPEPSYSEIPLSDDTEEESEEEFSQDESISVDMREGLDDLIAYTEKYSAARNQDYETASLNAIGKGKKKQLLIDDSLALDLESLATLQDKYSSRLENKARKRKTKEDFVDRENKTSDDLFKKYPYGFHVQNIKDEFDLFLGKDKERLLFPPLDPHGNKTVMKFAQHYHTKSSKVGKGNRTHVAVQKTKKTRRNFPKYNLIDQLLKQRPVFMRIDVSKPKDITDAEKLKRAVSKFNTNEGELVGKDAPEIAHDNVGRKILVKLGWINGEGLGAHGNKGISEPLMATVKKNKSGLRHNVQNNDM